MVAAFQMKVWREGWYPKVSVLTRKNYLHIPHPFMIQEQLSEVRKSSYSLPCFCGCSSCLPASTRIATFHDNRLDTATNKSNAHTDVPPEGEKQTILLDEV